MKKRITTVFLAWLLAAWAAPSLMGGVLTNKVEVKNLSGATANTRNLERLSVSTGSTWTAIVATSGAGFSADFLRFQNATGLAMLTVSSSGHIAYPNATFWEDVNMGLGALGSGLSAPDPIAWATTGIIVYGFDGGSTLEQVYGTMELPHARKLDTDIKPHVHWAASTTATGHVVWQFEYVLADNFAASTSTTIAVSQATNTTAWHECYAGFSAISTVGMPLGSYLIFRLFRDPSAGVGDTYAGDAALIDFGIHYEKDMPGSRQEIVK